MCIWSHRANPGKLGGFRSRFYAMPDFMVAVCGPHESEGISQQLSDIGDRCLDTLNFEQYTGYTESKVQERAVKSSDGGE